MKSTPAGQDDISGTTERKWTQSTAALAHQWILICHTDRGIYIQVVLGATTCIALLGWPGSCERALYLKGLCAK